MHWDQTAFRVINGGEFDFVNVDFEASYRNSIVTPGLNHTYQRLINMDLSSQEQLRYGPVFDSPVPFEPYIDPNTGEQKYRPIASQDTVPTTYNPIEAQISVDGENFLNLAVHLSKVYADVNLIDNVMLHSDMRIFWGLPGRTKIFEDYPDLDYKQIDTDPMVKWNTSLHWSKQEDLRISLDVYDILADKQEIMLLTH